MSKDCSQRFIFNDADIRGESVQLESAYQEILAIHEYPPVVAELLGEFLLASVLLSSTIKFEGRLVLQVRGNGEIPLLMAEATHENKIRAIARMSDKLTSSDFKVLFQDAILAVTVEPTKGEKYQSLVPLKGNSLADCLEHYFDQSEQLKTFIKLSANGQQAGGMLLQQLPKQLVKDRLERDNQWQHVTLLAQTTNPAELLALNAEQLLRRLYVEDPLQLSAAKSITFQCSCSQERTAQALITIDPNELDTLFAETPVLAMNCEFCQKKYEFSRESVAEIVRGHKPAH